MKQVIIKYLEGRATELEQRTLLEWLRDKDNRIEFRNLVSEWKRGLDEDHFPGGGANSWNRVQEGLLKRNYYRWQRSRKFQMVFKYAAVFFFAISIGTTIWIFTGDTAKSMESHTNVIAQKGQVSRLDLPDGSRVWLNAGTTLSYDNGFSHNNRKISLTGEAYFDVAQDKALPLVVDCKGLKVKALGTKFNVAAYPDANSIDVVLEEGSVALNTPGKGSLDYHLKPGEMGSFRKEKRELSISSVKPKKLTAWRKGIISIYDQPLEKVVERLEKRYNQKFEVDDEVRELRYTFTIKNESLDQVIHLMERITPVKATQSDEIIRFKKDKKKKDAANK